MAERLTEAQKRVLAKAPGEWTRWQYMYGIGRHMFLNPTLDALENKGMIERAYVPSCWRITPAGRAALKEAGDG